ncbi:MAG: hypothetical protein MZW92_15140 [Comamonadaceae bacterium]|nr:hypothetical protein [Comamonadaceae bacterium]
MDDIHSPPEDALAARPRRGRGAVGNPDVRFAAWSRGRSDDGWGSATKRREPLATTLIVDQTKSILSRNDSPDVPLRPLDQPLPRLRARLRATASRGRPHAYLGLSPGLDFETRLVLQAGCRRSCCAQELARARLPRRRRSRWASTPTPTSRSSAGSASPAACSKCWSSLPPSGFASSPSRR